MESMETEAYWHSIYSSPPGIIFFFVHVSCTLCGIFGNALLLLLLFCFVFLFHGPFCYGILETRTHILSLYSFLLFSLCSFLLFFFILFSLIPVFRNRLRRGAAFESSMVAPDSGHEQQEEKEKQQPPQPPSNQRRPTVRQQQIYFLGNPYFSLVVFQGTIRGFVHRD